MSDRQQAAAGDAIGERALDPRLFSGAKGTVDDVRVQSGYPVWNLADAWIASRYDDKAIVRDYHLDPAEWAAAKQYYLDHKPVFDARIITNTQPDADEDVPPLRTVEEYFAWLVGNTASHGAEAI